MVTPIQQTTVQLNSVQLNVVTVVDVARALATGSLENSLYMMDNSPYSKDQGTSRLSTTCRPGQVINWIIYPMDSPVSARISNISFLDGEVCTRLEIYGAYITPTSPWPCLTPTYDYWAGLILPHLSAGTYRYRLEIQLRTATGMRVLCVDTPSFNIMPLPTSRWSGVSVSSDQDTEEGRQYHE